MRVSGEHHFGGLGKAALAHDFDESAKGSKKEGRFQRFFKARGAISFFPSDQIG
jgi:hypothetical protein